MKRHLSGNLRNLAPPTLLRVLAATSTSGILVLETDAGDLTLRVEQGRVPAASDEELLLAGQVLASTDGEFRFQPTDLEPAVGVTLPLTAYADAALSWADRKTSSFSSDLDLERLVAGDMIDFSLPVSSPNIHVLADSPLENPIEDLLSDLQANAPGELLFAQVGAVVSDPRMWRGTLESEWRRRGWELHVHAAPAGVAVANLDILLVHHRMSITRVGQEEEWTELVRAAEGVAPPVPVVWIGPLGDPVWVHRLIDAGVTFLMPTPQGDGGETLRRFLDALTNVVERQLQARQPRSEPDVPEAVFELVDALLHDVDPEQGLSSLLQLAAGSLLRGAVLRVEDTAFRSWAGFGYPLSQGSSLLPRGVGLLERVVRSREPVVGIDSDGAGAVQLARVLGIDRLTSRTAIIPLGAGASVGGVLVGDRDGEPLPDLQELAVVVGRVGGVVVQS